MGIDKFYVGGEINWVMILEDLDSNDNIPEKAKMLKSIINHEANKQSETYYERGWNACKAINNKIKRFNTRIVKDAVLEDDFAVVTVREFIRWYASVLDEVRLINTTAECECCREVAALIGDKMDNSLKGISTDRRLLFSSVPEVLNAEYKSYDREE